MSASKVYPFPCACCARVLTRQRQHKGRRLCSTCWTRHDRLGTLHLYPPLTRRFEDVLDDLRILRARRPDLTQRQLAAQMGMTHYALDTALVRARRRGIRC